VFKFTSLTPTCCVTSRKSLSKLSLSSLTCKMGMQSLNTRCTVRTKWDNKRHCPFVHTCQMRSIDMELDKVLHAHTHTAIVQTSTPPSNYSENLSQLFQLKPKPILYKHRPIQRCSPLCVLGGPPVPKHSLRGHERKQQPLPGGRRNREPACSPRAERWRVMRNVFKVGRIFLHGWQLST
jgi:hypothetical protein